MTKKFMYKKDISIAEDKLKPLIPVLRTKKRFIKIKIEGRKKYDFKELSSKLTEELIFYIGAIDFGKGGIWILRDKFNFENQEFVLKVSTKLKDKVIGTIALINEIGNEHVKLNVLRVSGTLKGLEKN